MLLTQLIVGAFFAASLLLRVTYMSTALTVLMPWNTFAPTSVFDVFTKTTPDVMLSPSRPQLYELLYPTSESSPVCVETRLVAPILNLDRDVHLQFHPQTSQGLDSFHTPNPGASPLHKCVLASGVDLVTLCFITLTLHASSVGPGTLRHFMPVSN